MRISSSDVLKAVVDRGGYFLWERGLPAGKLKCDVISARDADGREMMVLGNLVGNMPRDWLNDFLRASYVEEDMSAKNESTMVFRPTRDAWNKVGAHKGRIKIDVPDENMRPRFVGSIPASVKPPADAKVLRRYGEVWRWQVSSEAVARALPDFLPA
jgi:hypothetical protein